MDISAASFRDKKLEAFSVTYNWESGDHSAAICMRAYEGKIEKYCVVGLSELYISEDFNHLAEIEFCTLLASPGRVYISFDPFTEGVESDQDNYCIIGRDIVALD
jgi:hypothetical protein